MTNTFIVRMKKDKVDKPKKGKVKGEVPAIDAYVAELTAEQVEELNLDPDVRYVEHDMPVFADTIEAAFSWGLDNAAYPMDGNYEYLLTGKGVEAYIIDSGIQATHQNFGGRVIKGQTWIQDGHGDADWNGHGTHVAGIVGGTYSGVAKAVTLIPMRVLDGNGWGTVSNVLFAVQWIINRKSSGKYKKVPMVANISIGFSGVSPSLDSAINQACDKGIAVCVAAGNNNIDASMVSPASAVRAITVGALNPDDTRAVYSNYGNGVDIWAAGTGIQSSWVTGDDVYAVKSGTSMASPHVCGVAALYLERYPTATVAQIVTAIRNYARTNGEGLKVLNSNFLL